MQLLFDSLGGSTCVLVSYGDGTMEMYGTESTCQSVLDVSPAGTINYISYIPLTNPMPLIHNYQ